MVESWSDGVVECGAGVVESWSGGVGERAEGWERGAVRIVDFVAVFHDFFIPVFQYSSTPFFSRHWLISNLSKLGANGTVQTAPREMNDA